MGLPEVGELLHNKENNQEKGQRAEQKKGFLTSVQFKVSEVR